MFYLRRREGKLFMPNWLPASTGTAVTTATLTDVKTNLKESVCLYIWFLVVSCLSDPIQKRLVKDDLRSVTERRLCHGGTYHSHQIITAVLFWPRWSVKIQTPGFLCRFSDPNGFDRLHGIRVVYLWPSFQSYLAMPCIFLKRGRSLRGWVCTLGWNPRNFT